jgi:O-antigen/teichoic acid export membrane protein
MSRAIVNTVANFGGLAVTLLSGLAFAILYFRMLGPQSYGLVGLAVTLVQFGTYFADMGIGRVLVRELARSVHLPNPAARMRNTFFTLQLTHFALACAVGLVIALSSRWLAGHWLQLGSFPIDDAANAIVLMGLLAALQLPRAMAAEAMRGLQRQVLSNLLISFFALFRGGTTVVALLAVSGAIDVYLKAQIVTSFIETFVMTAVAWRFIPSSPRWPRFDLTVIRETWAFGAADGGGVIVAAAMMLGDKIVLSRLLPLDAYGSYVFCASLADVVARASGPFNSAFFPHFVSLIARGEQSRLSRDYLGASQIVSALLIPTALVIAFFAPDIIHLLLRDTGAATGFAPVLALRALGNLANCLLQMPHGLQLATGLSSLFLKLNLASIVIYLPSILVLTPRFGVIVAPAAWLCINLLNAVPMVVGAHRRILQHDAWRWFAGAVVRPALITIVVVVASRLFAPAAVSWWITGPWLVATAMLAAAAILISSWRLRDAGLRVLRSQFAVKGSAVVSGYPPAR